MGTPSAVSPPGCSLALLAPDSDGETRLMGAGLDLAVIVDPDAAEATSHAKNQVVLELTEQIWRDAIKMYDLEGKESIIPTREAFVPPVQTGKYKW